MAEDTTNPVFGPGQQGVGQGIWQYTGHRSYTAKTIAFIHFDTTNHNGPPFKMAASHRTDHRVQR